MGIGWKRNRRPLGPTAVLVPHSETGFLCTRAAFSINGIPHLVLRVYQPPPFPCYRRPIFSRNKWVIHEDETSVCNMMYTFWMGAVEEKCVKYKKVKFGPEVQSVAYYCDFVVFQNTMSRNIT